MPTIYDNIESKLLEGLRSVLPEAVACSFCVGYLNLRGWAQLADAIEHLQGGMKLTPAVCLWGCIARPKRR
jgi:hypothetical protein